MSFANRLTAFALSVVLSATVMAKSQGTSVPLPRTSTNSTSEEITINAQETGTSFPHFWDQMFGAGDSTLALRESYRTDLRKVKTIADFRYVRFHNIFGDEVGLYNLGSDGKPYYNFTYVDQIYDGLLANGVRPFVELSFVPDALASKKKEACRGYQPNTVPPKDYALWDDMIDKFVRHLIQRYGIDEISQWYFEVWNEPDSDFLDVVEKQATYYVLYDHTVNAIKKVDTRLRVGGPGTSNSEWISSFLDHCLEHHLPIDFVSSHMYSDEDSQPLFGPNVNVPLKNVVCSAVSKVRSEIDAAGLPKLPFILSEFNASWLNKPEVTDSVYMGPWLADTIRQCAGSVDMMSYWTFSDVFEELGIASTPFYGGYGLLAEGGIPKPAFNAFALMHRLGDTRLKSDSDSVLITRRKDGTLVIALWNYVERTTDAFKLGTSKKFQLTLNGVPKDATTYISRLDATHGNVLTEFDAMGRPSWPTQKEFAQLREAGKLSPAEVVRLRNSHLTVEIPGQGLVLLEVR